MRITPNSEAQKNSFIPSGGFFPYAPPSEKTTITSCERFIPKIWILSKLTSCLNFLKRLMGIKCLSFYEASWVFEKKIALAESPKEHQIESFWQMVWYADVSVIAAFSDPKPNPKDLTCFYWPTSPSTPLFFMKTGISVKLKSDDTEYYVSQNQLLIRREFLLEKGKKSRTVVQLVSFPDANQKTYEKAVLAAKASDKKNQTILALYTGWGRAAYPFIELYKKS